MNSIHELKLRGKRVLVRTDFNVPMDDQGNITDDIRIRMVLPTLEHILKEEGKLIICSHMGRPDGMRVEQFSLRPVAECLRNFLDARSPSLLIVSGQRLNNW